MVVGRQLLIRVAVAVVVFLVIAFPVGDKHQGVLGVVGNVTWYGFLLSFLLLIVLGVVALVQSWRPRAGS
jgi:hypothetical protein